ncbi:MAG: hypothetical protein ACI4M6_05550 [Christensenellaceae bacterium]
MKFNYEDLISGDSIPVSGVGHIRSPQLWELKPTQGIGAWKYNFYLNLLIWDKDELIKFMRLSTGKKLKALDNAEKLTAFDVITLLDSPRKLLQDAMAFFMDENICWNNEKKVFITFIEDTNNVTGVINRDNFEDVRDMMLQVNYINLGRMAKPQKFASKKAKELWERAQQYLKNGAKKKADKRMQLGNIISKLSCVSTGYTLLNIFNLTVFQLYDQFFQYGYLRAMDLNEMAFSNHGGKNFDMQAWLKPIINN